MINRIFLASLSFHSRETEAGLCPMASNKAHLQRKVLLLTELFLVRLQHCESYGGKAPGPPSPNNLPSSSHAQDRRVQRTSKATRDYCAQSEPVVSAGSMFLSFN